MVAIAGVSSVVKSLAKIIADSVAPSGCRLTTFEFRIPKCLLAEFNTHRMLSKNAASSRAIPVWKILKQIMEDPYIPHFGRNKPGMQAGDMLTASEIDAATRAWLRSRDTAYQEAKYLSDENIWWVEGEGFIHIEGASANYKLALEKRGARALEVHKQTANRLLEPFMKVDVVATGTDWQNVWHLRDHHMAHPDIQEPIRQGHALYNASRPRLLSASDPHLPYVLDAERDKQDQDTLVKCSVARCGRTSMENQDGVVSVESDLILYGRLEDPDPNDRDAPMHASPFEHVAFAMAEYVAVAGVGWVPGHRVRSGNFSGWLQHRKQNPREVRPEPLWDPTTGDRRDINRPRQVQYLVPAGLYLRNKENPAL